MKKELRKITITFCFILSLTSVFAQSNPFIGSWLGQIDTLGVKLRIAFHISEQTGIIITKMDSPDQNSFGNPANKTTITDNNIVIDFPLMGAKYDGQLKNEELVGVFYQSGLNLQLSLKRFKGELSAPKRPQTPVSPFPYSEKEVTIKTSDEKVKLSGTLTIPEGKGPFPAVVLISGSGPQDRNEELMGHKPFLVLADYLSRNGIAVLRYDDRGVGKSTGNFAKATSFDFAEDAEAVWNFLSRQKKIDKTKVGLLGHSEGGSDCCN
jgi:predicted acyl esterase